MKVRYFTETDTLYIEPKPRDVTDSRDLDEYTVVEYAAAGHLCSITIEDASERAGLPQFSFEYVAAPAASRATALISF